MFEAIDTVVDLTKAGFKPIETAKPRHLAAVGKFLLAVGIELDAQLNAHLQYQINNAEEAVTRAMVGEMRTGDVMAALRRIVVSRSPKESVVENMDALFKEIGALRHTRDIIAHRFCMIAGNKLAFHNAFLAKTGASIEVKIYTVADLDEFSRYAKRLGFRIKQVFGTLTPSFQSPAKQAALVLLGQTLLLHATRALVTSGKVPKSKLANVRSVVAASYEAVTAYTKAARNIDPRFVDLQQAAATKMAEFLSAIALVDAPDEKSLREIPLQLQTRRRSRRKATSRSRPRQRRASPA